MSLTLMLEKVIEKLVCSGLVISLFLFFFLGLIVITIIMKRKKLLFIGEKRKGR